jgi:hypothetical protein
MARRKQDKDNAETVASAEAKRRPAGADPAGQAGDLQGLSDEAEADSESVRERLEEGQTFEAAVVSGIENAPPADAGEVETQEVPEDDVPSEYLEHDPDEPKE